MEEGNRDAGRILEDHLQNKECKFTNLLEVFIQIPVTCSDDVSAWHIKHIKAKRVVFMDIVMMCICEWSLSS